MHIYRLIQKPAGQRLVLTNLGFLALALGRYTEAQATYLQAMALGKQLGGLQDQVICHLNLACAAELQDDPVAEKQHSEQALALARQAGLRFLEAHALTNLGGAERKLGHAMIALGLVRESAAIFAEMGHRAEYASALKDLALIHLTLGELPEAGLVVEELLALYPEVCEKTDDPQRFLWVVGYVFFTRGQIDAAKAILAQAYEVFLEKLAAIPDAESEAAYRQIYFNRQIAAAYERGEWPRAL
jgi:tetratricopeptide (TPR) repeat protein